VPKEHLSKQQEASPDTANREKLRTALVEVHSSVGVRCFVTRNMSPYIQDSKTDPTKQCLHVSPGHNVSLVSTNSSSTEKQSFSWGDTVPLYADDEISTEEK